MIPYGSRRQSYGWAQPILSFIKSCLQQVLNQVLFCFYSGIEKDGYILPCDRKRVFMIFCVPWDREWLHFFWEGWNCRARNDLFPIISWSYRNPSPPIPVSPEKIDISSIGIVFYSIWRIDRECHRKRYFHWYFTLFADIACKIAWFWDKSYNEVKEFWSMLGDRAVWLLVRACYHVTSLGPFYWS